MWSTWSFLFAPSSTLPACTLWLSHNRSSSGLCSSSTASLCTWRPCSIRSPTTINYENMYYLIVLSNIMGLHINRLLCSLNSLKLVFIPDRSVVVVVVGLLLLTWFLLSGRFTPNSGESMSSKGYTNIIKLFFVHKKHYSH